MKIADLMKKLSLICSIVFMATLLLPIVSYASTLFLTYYPSTGKLSGLIYINDPDKVKVAVFDSVYQPTYLGASTPVSATYDDNNVYIQENKYDLAWGSTAPSKITLEACNQTVELRKFNYSNDTVGYVTYDGFWTGSLRSTGTEYLSEYSAGTHVPSAGRLFSFTPQTGGATSIRLELPGDWGYPSTYHTSIDRNKLTISDLSLTDTTVNQAVYISGLDLTFGSIGMFNLTTDPLTKDHTYSLQLSNSSGGDEILLPPAGSYDARIDMDTVPWVWASSTQVKFRKMTLGTGTPGGTEQSRDTGSPYGDMGNCTAPTASEDGQGGSNDGDSGATSGNTAPGSGTLDNTGSGSTPVTTPSDNPVQEVPNGVSLGKGAATVTKETVDGKQITRVQLDPEKLGQAFGIIKNKDKGAQTVTVAFNSADPTTTVDLPGSALATAAKDANDAIIVLKSDSSSYELPVRLLDIDQLSADMNTQAKDITVHVKIEQVSGASAEKLKDKAKEMNAALLTEPLDFAITAEAGGKQREINDFHSTYVTRSMMLPGSVDSSTASAVMYDPMSGKFAFVPAMFIKVDGKTEVRMKRTGNSIYSVIQTNAAFSDLESHWAKPEVELLARKQLLEGTAADRFSPDKPVTRGEFVAMLTRGLGLNEQPASARFADVAMSDWFAGYVGAAVKSGLIDGFEDGTFRPDAMITREQMASLMVRAAAFAGAQTKDQVQSQASFSDNASISSWAQQDVAKAAAAGFVQGAAGGSFDPQAAATRAQAAVMLKRMLAYVKFIG